MGGAGAAAIVEVEHSLHEMHDASDAMPLFGFRFCRTGTASTPAAGRGESARIGGLKRSL